MVASHSPCDQTARRVVTTHTQHQRGRNPDITVKTQPLNTQLRLHVRPGKGKQSTYIYVGRVNVVRAGDSVHLAQNHSGMVIWESKQPMVLGQGATGAQGVFIQVSVTGRI